MAYFSPKNSILVVLWKFFWVDTRRKYGPFKSKNNPQIVLKQLPNNLEKGQNFVQKKARQHHHYGEESHSNQGDPHGEL